RMITGLLVPGCTLPATGALRLATALGVFSWLQITHINLRFVFLLFAHITFLSFVSCFFGFGVCQPRRNICRRLQPSRLGSGRPNGSAYLSNASAVELRSEEHTSELQSRFDLVCRLLLEKKNK